MLRRGVSVIFMMMVAMSSAASLQDLWRCSTVNPVYTSMDQMVGRWYIQEMNLAAEIRGAVLCFDFEIQNLESSDSANKTYSFLIYSRYNGRERTLSGNRTMEMSPEYPGLLFTRGMDHVGAIVAETDDKKLVCLATCSSKYRNILETFIFSRDKNVDPDQIQEIRNKVKAAGITPEDHLLVRNSTICDLNPVGRPNV